MGLDFDLIRKPQPVRDAHQRLIDSLSHTARSPEDWDPDGSFERASDDLRRAEDAASSSFSFSWFAWNPYRVAMDQRGMLSHDPPQPAPDLSALGYNGHCGFEALFDPTITPEAADAVADWLEQQPASPGLAAFKLSNDWWVITPEECESALAALGNQPPPPLERWDEWIQFLRAAIEAGGIRVS